MEVVARQAIAAAKRGDPLAQPLLGLFQTLVLVAALGEVVEKLSDQRRNRGTPLRRDDPGLVIRPVVHRNCDIFHRNCVTVKL
jgi:hypothetical protein